MERLMPTRTPVLDPPGATGVALKHPTREVVCVRTWNTIQPGDWAVALEGEIHDVWLELSSADDVSKELVQFNINERPPVALADDGGVMYAHLGEKEGTCIACGEDMRSQGDTGIRFETGNRSWGQWAWCHSDCVDVLASALNNIDNL